MWMEKNFEFERFIRFVVFDKSFIGENIQLGRQKSIKFGEIF